MKTKMIFGILAAVLSVVGVLSLAIGRKKGVQHGTFER